LETNGSIGANSHIHAMLNNTLFGWIGARFNGIMNNVIEQAKQMDKEQRPENLIGFEIYFNNNWDF
jgi:hypothetical protein